MITPRPSIPSLDGFVLPQGPPQIATLNSIPSSRRTQAAFKQRYNYTLGCNNIRLLLKHIKSAPSRESQRTLLSQLVDITESALTACFSQSYRNGEEEWDKVRGESYRTISELFHEVDRYVGTQGEYMLQLRLAGLNRVLRHNTLSVPAAIAASSLSHQPSDTASLSEWSLDWSGDVPSSTCDLSCLHQTPVVPSPASKHYKSTNLLPKNISTMSEARSSESELAKQLITCLESISGVSAENWPRIANPDMTSSSLDDLIVTTSIMHRPRLDILPDTVSSSPPAQRLPVGESLHSQQCYSSEILFSAPSSSFHASDSACSLPETAPPQTPLYARSDLSVSSPVPLSTPSAPRRTLARILAASTEYHSSRISLKRKWTLEGDDDDLARRPLGRLSPSAVQGDEKENMLLAYATRAHCTPRRLLSSRGGRVRRNV